MDHDSLNGARNTAPLISVIVPAHNVENYVRKCIDSILGQTYPRLEVIAFNDGSSDGTGRILAEIASTDSRLRVIDNPVSSGVYEARRRSFIASRGSLIGFVDADDWIEPEMYGDMLAAMMNSDSDIVICGANAVNEEGDYDGKRLGFSRDKLYSDNVFDEFCKLTFGSGWLWNKLYKRDHIDASLRQPMDKAITKGDDYCLNAFAFHKASRVQVLRARYYNYLIRSESLSHSASPVFSFTETLRAYLYLVESFRSGSDGDLHSIDKLFGALIRHYSSKIRNWTEFATLRPHLMDTMGRLAMTRPEAIHALINYKDAAPLRVRIENRIDLELRTMRRAIRKWRRKGS